jgi:hypothetical protein
MPRPPIDITGQKFGRLTAIRREGLIANRLAWLCVCDCGNTKTTTSTSLRRGDTRSCGCAGLGKASTLTPSGRKRYDKPKTFVPPPQVHLPCYTCARWKPLEESDLGGYCEGGVFLIAKPHLGSCSYKA